MILDYVEIIAAILIFTIGGGFNHLRLLIVASIVASSVFFTVAQYFDVIQSLEPGLYYFNFVLPLGICLMSFVNPNKFTQKAGMPLFLIALVNFFVYLEYYTGTSLFYDVYEESMLALTAWQLWLLIRIGDVGGNLKRFKRFLTNIVWHSNAGSYNYSHSEHGRIQRSGIGRGR